MAANISPIYLPGDDFCKITKWHVRKGTKINVGKLLLTYKPEGGNALLKLKSEVVGTVQETHAKEGHVMPPGSMLLQVRDCEHAVVMKDMCAECGADLRQDGGRPGLRKETVSASVAMVHCVPELIISQQHALEIGLADEQRLRSSRKLVLLVDLDQTLLHTTNDNIPPNLKDVYHFQLIHNDAMTWYHTKFRPGTQAFLENISKLYEMHICTFGVRMYAHTIARYMDPDGKHFSHRILSRDECFNATSKTANLKALFPCGDSMVVIIDDREDVWNFAKNLVHVKPYHFFVGTADINAPPGLGKDEQDTKTEPPHVKERGKGHSESTQKDTAGADNEPDSQDHEEAAVKSSNSTTTSMGKMLSENNVDNDGDMDTKKSNRGHSYKSSSEPSDTKEDVIEWEDSDDYLTHLEEILTRIHKAYFDVCDEMSAKSGKPLDMPDLKNIVPYVKKKTLKGCNIVFSGVFPLNVPLEKSREYHVARSLGATVQTSFVPAVGENPNRTTHVVAARLGTEKVKQAQRSNGVCVVTPDWLAACNDRWERVDERLFLLTSTFLSSGSRDKSPDALVVKEETSLKRKHGSLEKSPVDPLLENAVSGVSKRTKLEPRNSANNQVKDYATQTGLGKVNPSGSGESVFADVEMEQQSAVSSQSFARSFNPLFSFSSDELEDMDKEVEEILESENDLDSESDNDSERAERELRRRVLSGESESSSEESLSGEYPKGWKRRHEGKGKRKVKQDDRDGVGEDVGDGDDDDGDNGEGSFRLGGDNSSSGADSDYAESIGSVDEEMAAEVEKLISRQTPF